MEVLEFHGGPIDGALMTVNSDQWIGEVSISIPSFTSDEETVVQTHHNYVCVHSTYDNENESNGTHFMGHVSIEKESGKKETFDEILKLFDEAS